MVDMLFFHLFLKISIKKLVYIIFFSYITYVISNINDMIKTKKKTSTIEIDLTGPDGNAFYLLGFASKLANSLGMNSESIVSEMKSGDYENLVQVFDKNFGSLITLYR